MRIKAYNKIVSNMSSATSREATLWQDSFYVLIHQLVLVSHLNAGSRGQYVSCSDNASAYNYNHLNHSYAP
nr:MAG TPA: hypothetical protein [Caudoviricetes sp.]